MSKRYRATDFFERQDLARRNTVRLVALFAMVYLVLTVGTYVVLLLSLDAMAFVAGIEPEWFLVPLLAEDVRFELIPELAWMSFIGTAAFLFLGGLTKTTTLKEGGASVAEELGGKEVNASSYDPLVRRFVNVVEEMSLASGVPVPRTFVLEKQDGINAFVAGYSINDTVLAITRGALRQLNRDELQAVVAHEFSHILNGDMRLNLRLIGILHGTVCIFLAGLALCRLAWPSGLLDELRSPSRTSGGVYFYGPFLFFPGAVLVAFGYGGLVGSRLIKAGIARQREYLADAAAVQFTRNPDALVSALKKIGGYHHGSRITGSGAEMVSHMCFGEGTSSWLTHPPIEERVVALDPSYNPDEGFSVLDAVTERSELDSDEEQRLEEEKRRTSTGLADTFNPDHVIDAIGQTSPEGLIYCATLLASIPEPLREARTDLAGAVATAYLLLLDKEPEKRRLQAQIIQEQTGSSIAREAKRLWPVVKNLDAQVRLPLMDLLLPELRRMTRKQYEEFARVADALIRADGEVSLHEFVLERVVLHRLAAAFDGATQKSVQFGSFSGVIGDLENVLSALAYASSDKVGVVQLSFEAGRRYFPDVVARKLRLRDKDRWSYDNIAASLERLAVSAPAIKRAVVEACAHCVMADGEVVVEEAELLRAVCDILDAPLPPFVSALKMKKKPTKTPGANTSKEPAQPVV